MIDPTEINLNNLGILPKLATPITPPSDGNMYLNLFLAASLITLVGSIYYFTKKGSDNEFAKQRRNLPKNA